MAERRLPGDGSDEFAGAIVPVGESGGVGPFARHRDPVRDRLLLAMAQSCAANGYRQVTVEDVLARSALSQNDFDARFAGLEECFDAAIESLASQMITVATGEYSPDKPLAHVVRDATGAVLRLLAARPAFARMAFVDGSTATPRSIEQRRTVIQMLSALLDQLRVDSVGLQPPVYAARAAIGGAEALIASTLVAHRADRLPALLPEIVYCTLNPFLGQDEALRHSQAARRAGEGSS